MTAGRAWTDETYALAFEMDRLLTDFADPLRWVTVVGEVDGGEANAISAVVMKRLREALEDAGYNPDLGEYEVEVTPTDDGYSITAKAVPRYVRMTGRIK